MSGDVGLTCSIIIPTYNEAQNLPVLFERLTAVLRPWEGAYEVIVVDDDSPDETWLVAEALQVRHPQLKVIRRMTGEKGLASAVVEGWRQARGAILGVMDADLQHPPELLPKMIERLEQNPDVDVVIASRYLADGISLKWNPIRKWISRGASNLAQAVLPKTAQQVTDPMSGCFFLRRPVVEQVHLQPKGYKILLEVLGRGRYRKVAEVPYQFGKRHAGSSKLGARVMMDYLFQLGTLIWAPSGLGRFVRYCLVGSSGVVVNLGVTGLLRYIVLWGKLRSAAVGIESSILNNFVWNEWWTFKDRTAVSSQVRARLARLLFFNVICGVGAGFQLAFVWLAAIHWKWPYMLVNLLAIGVVTLWNYGLNLTWTWTGLAPGGGD